jgi:ABC-2 type transport system permease protein
MQNALEYRGAFMLNLINSIWPILIQFFLWSSLYRATDGMLFGYTYAQMITYTIFANIVQQFLRTGYEYEINNDVKNGGLDKFIVRPIGYFNFYMTSFFGGKLVMSVFVFVLLGTAALIINSVFGAVVTLTGIAMFLAVLVLACALNFIIFFCVGMLAFWLTEIGFFFEAVRIVFIAASGGIFPLDVLGPGAVAILNWLPFRYTVNFPVDVICGRLTAEQVLPGLLVMGLWIVVLRFAANALWRKGLKRYIAAGG